MGTDCLNEAYCFNLVDSSVEVAVTGSGIPVALVPSPSDTFDFSHCAMGQHSDLLCVLQNLCPQLPIRFRFRKLAHFTAHPPTGTIAPGQCQVRLLAALGGAV